MFLLFHSTQLASFGREICFLSIFLSQVILIAYNNSFKMRYWGDVTSENIIRAVYLMTFVQILVYASRRTYILASSGRTELEKKF